MELPKNITQIGEANHRCKIYVEDYVISYMKQLNQVAQDKDMAVALYGIRKEEKEVSYLFLYGACKLNFLQKETRHLSQAQQQEIEKCRTKYFSDYTFLGYRLLNGEMIEGFHVCEQGICRYIPGYAQFYEKNDSMLAYMLDARGETQPEVVDQEKYEVVKKKQEEQKLQKPIPQNSSVSSSGLRGMRFAIVAVFALLCLVGVSSMNGEGKIEDLQAVARQVMDEAMQQQLPDAVSETKEVIQVDTLIAEDKLAEAILQENEAIPSEDASEASVQQSEVEQVSAPAVTEIVAETEEVQQVAESPAVAEAPSVEETPSMEESPTVVETTPTIEETVVVDVQPTSYTIKEGDTLIGISVQNYGSDVKVADICSLNQIDNPDDIKVGQKILLP